MIDATIGGLLIGLAAVWLMLSIGRVAGISGIVATAVSRKSGTLWALLFVLGIGGHVGAFFTEAPAVRDVEALSLTLVLGGVLVGFGTRLGSGCTSGHGVCGIARFSVRSIVATATFLFFGVVTATWVHA